MYCNNTLGWCLMNKRLYELYHDRPQFALIIGRRADSDVSVFEVLRLQPIEDLKNV